MNDRRFIFVNQYYNVLTEFLGEKAGQAVQALLQVVLQVVLRDCHLTNRSKIGLILEVERQHEAIFPVRVEVRNESSESRKHSLPRAAGDILLRVNGFLKGLEGRYTNFEVTENNWILSHVLFTDILFRHNI